MTAWFCDLHRLRVSGDCPKCDDELIAMTEAETSMTRPVAVEKDAPVNPCYRTLRHVPHAAHIWRNGIEVPYDVRCAGFPTKGAT